MASKTMSNEGGSNSGISDVKYQKAIKEISKLISLNTDLKNKYDTLQAKYTKLQQDYQKLQHNSCSGQNLTASDTVNNKLQDPPQLSNFMSTEFNDPSQLSGYKDKLQSLQHKVAQKQQLISFLQNELDKKQKQISDLLTKNNSLGQLNTSLQDKIKKLSVTKSHEREKENIKLKRQLQKSEEWVRKLSNDYEILKKQLMFNSKTSINANSIEINSSNQPLQSSISDFYIEKLKKAQMCNAKLKKKINENKKKLKAGAQKLKKQNEGLKKKVAQLSEFVEKQQSFITKYIKAEKLDEKK